MSARRSTSIMTARESARVWRRISPPDETTGCRLWTGSVAGKGRVGMASADSRRQYVPRLTLAEHLGRELAPDEDVIHGCGNPSCVSPEHLGAVPFQRRAQHRTAAARGRSPFMGVSWNSKLQRWRVQLRVGDTAATSNGARIASLGSYADEVDAAYVAQIARLLSQPGAGTHERPLPPIHPYRYLRLFLATRTRLTAASVELVDRSGDDIAILLGV